MHAHDGAKPSHRSPALDCLRQQLIEELGPGIGVAFRDVNGNPQELWPIEREAVLKAIPRRQREFAAGRLAAREAMVQIGWPPEAIPSAPDRSPVWPDGLMGSIAHNRHTCVAIAGQRDQVHAIGIDIEEDLGIDPTLWAAICTRREQTSIASLPKSEQGRYVTRLFCAKEAFYKWQHPQTKQMLDFCDIEVTLSRNGTGFRVQPAAPGKPRLLLCGSEGRLLPLNGVVLAWLIGSPATKG